MIKQHKDVLEKYAKIKGEIKKLELELEIYNPQILDIMQSDGLEELSLEKLATFSLAQRRTWVYPLEIQGEEKSLKEKKKVAEQTGEASCTLNPYLICKLDK